MTKRSIRKRLFDVKKSLKIYRDYGEIYQYLNGENYTEAGLASFEANERYENKDKIAEMFEKKKKNVPIPIINQKTDIDEKGNPSEKSSSTEASKEIFKPREEEGPADFKYVPMGPVKESYIKYAPRMTPIGNTQDYSKIDYMLTDQDWEEAKNSSKGISDNMKDLVEEMFDKFEKYTAKGDIQPIDKYKSALSPLPMITKKNFPHDAQLKSIYNGWLAARKKNGNALCRKFWKKPDQTESSPTASFRSRVTEKIQTRRKNKNDQGNYLKLQSLREEIVSGRNILGQVSFLLPLSDSLCYAHFLTQILTISRLFSKSNFVLTHFHR